MIELPDLSQARSSADVTRLLGQWRDALTRSLRLPPVARDGLLLQGVDLSTTPVAINHGLSETPSGWLVVRSRGAAAAAIAETAVTSRTLTLVATASVTVDLWVWP